MSQDGITLWGTGTIRVLRVHWALLELGLPYRTEAIHPRNGDTLTARYTELTPKQKVPFLTDGDLRLSESAAIVHYLFDRYGEAKEVFRPDSADDKARSNEWCYFVMSEIDAHSLYVIRRHRHLEDIYGPAPEAVASAEEYCLKQMTAVTPRIAEADPYLFGDRLSAADILVATCVEWAIDYGIPLASPCLEYFECTRARPAYQKAREATY